MRDRLQALKNTVSLYSSPKEPEIFKYVCFFQLFQAECKRLSIQFIDLAIVTYWRFDQFILSTLCFSQGNTDDEDPQDDDEPSTIVNVENIFMDNFFQNVSFTRLMSKIQLALSRFAQKNCWYCSLALNHLILSLEGYYSTNEHR